MTLHKNPSGFIRADSEKELYQRIEEAFLKKHLRSWKDQQEFAPNCVIDFLAYDLKGQITLIEVKNWFVTCKDMQQIMKYLCHASTIYGSSSYRFILICGGIPKKYRELLEPLAVEIILTREIFDGYR